MTTDANRIHAILQENPNASDGDVLRTDDGLTFGDLRAIARGGDQRHATPGQWDAAIAALDLSQEDEDADTRVHVEAVANALGIIGPHPEAMLARMTGTAYADADLPPYDLQLRIASLTAAIHAALKTKPRVGLESASDAVHRPVVEFDDGDPYEILRKAVETSTVEPA